MISQKCQYALRALFELARRESNGPVTAADLARTQAIPPQFLEVILGELKQGGFVLSRRGRRGGYLLGKLPEETFVGDVIRFIEGPLGPVSCVSSHGESCDMGSACVFLPMWERAYKAMAEVYDTTNLRSLVEDERRRTARIAPQYTI